MLTIAFNSILQPNYTFESIVEVHASVIQPLHNDVLFRSSRFLDHDTEGSQNPKLAMNWGQATLYQCAPTETTWCIAHLK